MMLPSESFPPTMPHRGGTYLTPMSSRSIATLCGGASATAQHLSTSTREKYPGLFRFQQATTSTSTSASTCRGTGTTSYSHIPMDSDRYIPSRRRTNMDVCRHALNSNNKRPRDANNDNNDNDSSSTSTSTSDSATDDETRAQKQYKRYLKSILCNIPLEQLNEDAEPRSLLAFGSGHFFNRDNDKVVMPRQTNPYDHDVMRTVKHGLGCVESGLSAASVSASGPKKAARKVISSSPTSVLDAPGLVDDYYINTMSWSKDNVLAVALGESVYTNDMVTGDVDHLATVSGSNNYVTSVQWCDMPGRTNHIAIGTNASCVYIFDAEAGCVVSTLRSGGSVGYGRVSALAWNGRDMLTTAGSDSTIYNYDLRVPDVSSRYYGHSAEVCSLKWNEDGSILASGGNDDKVCIWDASMMRARAGSLLRDNTVNNNDGPRLTLMEHKSAVKALAWCPFNRGLLASGGGSADQCIRFWNTSSGSMLNSIDTGSQVSSIVWSKTSCELISSHGNSENQLVLWDYPSMNKVKELKGHKGRILNMYMSPDGASVVTSSADETLRFWDVFDSVQKRAINKPHKGAMFGIEPPNFGGFCIR